MLETVALIKVTWFVWQYNVLLIRTTLFSNFLVWGWLITAQSRKSVNLLLTVRRVPDNYCPITIQGRALEIVAIVRTSGYHLTLFASFLFPPFDNESRVQTSPVPMLTLQCTQAQMARAGESSGTGLSANRRHKRWNLRHAKMAWKPAARLVVLEHWILKARKVTEIPVQKQTVCGNKQVLMKELKARRETHC